MPTINQWISCLEELWGDELEILKYSSHEIVVRIRQTQVDVNENSALSERVN